MPAPHPTEPDLLRALVEDLRQGYTQLLALVDHSLIADPQSEASQALAFQDQIRGLMAETQARLGLLIETIRPWDERRRAYPAELADGVDTFLALLEKGLRGVQSRLDHRQRDIEQRMAAMRQSMVALNQKRQGVQGYRQQDTRPKGFNKRA